MNQQSPREAVILTLTDEDFELIGVDPATISNEVFTEIAEILKEDRNEGFLPLLWNILLTHSLANRQTV